MIKLGSKCVLDGRSVAVVYLLGGEVSVRHFNLAKRKPKNTDVSNEEFLASAKWNGYGGTFEYPDKDIFDTAVRELKEKSGGVKVTKKALHLKGRVKIFYPENMTEFHDREVFFFTTYKHSKYPEETEKMSAPKLFSVHSAPYKDMRPSDKEIVRIIMSEKTVEGAIHFGLDHSGSLVMTKRSLVVSFF